MNVLSGLGTTAGILWHVRGFCPKDSLGDIHQNDGIDVGCLSICFCSFEPSSMCLALKHYGLKAIHRFALTPSPLSPGERGWGEGEMTIFAIERHFFVCQIAKQVLQYQIFYNLFYNLQKMK